MAYHSMIDGWQVVSNSIWICGCALALAVISYANWQANVNGERLRAVLSRPKMRVTLGVAGVLFCLGLAATSRSIVEIVLWLILAVVLIVQVLHDWRTFVL